MQQESSNHPPNIILYNLPLYLGVVIDSECLVGLPWIGVVDRAVMKFPGDIKVETEITTGQNGIKGFHDAEPASTSHWIVWKNVHVLVKGWEFVKKLLPTLLIQIIEIGSGLKSNVVVRLHFLKQLHCLKSLSQLIGFLFFMHTGRRNVTQSYQRA